MRKKFTLFNGDITRIHPVALIWFICLILTLFFSGIIRIISFFVLLVISVLIGFLFRDQMN